jgi:hypothetical protein
MIYRSVFLTSALDGDQLHAPAALSWGKGIAYPMEKKLDGPVMGSDAVETKNLDPAGNQGPDSCRPTHSLVSTLTELHQLLRLLRKNEKKSKRFRNSAAYFSNELPW